MPSTRDLPATIKVMGKHRGSSRSSKSRAESPLFDTRSRGTKSSHHTRGRGRDRDRELTKGEVSLKRNKSRDRSVKSRDRSRSAYEPPDHDVVEVTRHDADRQEYESRDDRRSPSRDRRRRHAYAERERERESERHREHERERERNRRRERYRNERKRRTERETRVYDEDGEHYRQFEEVADDDDYQYSNMPQKPVDEPDDVGGDPFNLCGQASGSFTDEELPPPSRTRRSRRAHRLANTSMSSAEDHLDMATWSGEERYYQPRQDHSYASIAVTAVQLLVLMLQLAMCGVAPLDVNPMVGPFPDAFSEWGGKNAYLMLEENQYWRLITPVFLHVGVLHLLANSFCLLYSSALFEREWGSYTWLFVYIISEIGCVGVSSVADPETIAVGSSGALMGLFAAKLAHVLTYTFFETYDDSQDENLHVDHLSGVLCGLTLVSLLSCFSYVDWSGHMGGLASGFFAGIFAFAKPIRSCCGSLMWSLFGFAGLAGTATLVVYLLKEETEPDEELGDACEYFRSLFPEGYQCGCLI